ncbi:8011_t:CDS:1 [Cetraspora pellucida]|uniref:8011_t:CDS:1 n=1 Tax=Cetraspora pellucida TaxID=1433469 RepID=A0ACA9PJY0_9GLOM|nr:8011_t:CDS:1 [Cetraspora pellucida]
MEYTFISRNILDRIMEEYITNLPRTKQEKTLINNKLLNKIKPILLNPKNTSLYDKNLYSCAKKKFELEEIIPKDYRVIVKALKNSVLITKKFYKVLYHIHDKVTQHGGQKQT